MRPIRFAVLLTSAVLAGTSTASGQRVMPARHPLAYLTPSLSLETRTTAVGDIRLSLDVPVGGVVRPWVSGGAWIFAMYDCIPEHIGPCNPSGSLVDAGVDLAPTHEGRAVLPFVGIGAGLHVQDQGGRGIYPVVRMGADLQPFPWLAPRILVEYSRYPGWGAAVLFTGGLRIGIPPMR